MCSMFFFTERPALTHTRCPPLRLEFRVKKEGWGGGSSRVVVFQRGQGDLAQLKPGGKTLSVTIGDGLPKNSSKLHDITTQPGLDHDRKLRAKKKKKKACWNVFGTEGVCVYIIFIECYFNKACISPEPTRKSSPQHHGGGRKNVAGRGKSYKLTLSVSSSV